MTSVRKRIASVATLLALLLVASPARAIVNQSDGTIIPVGDQLQRCLDKSPTFDPTANPAPAEGVMPFRIATVADARTQPQTFAIATGGARQVSTFTDIGEGSGFANVFGWYHVGDNPQVAANRHVIFGPRPGPVCPCPCDRGPRTAPDPAPEMCLTFTQNPANAGVPGAPVSNNIVQVDWTCLARARIYRGGPIAFFVQQTNGFVFSTLTRDNPDRDVHWLVYASKNFERRFYFAFEDLTRSTTNEFEDLVLGATEIVPACDPRPEVCDGVDQNCDGVADDNIPPLRCRVTGDTTGACDFTAPACVGGVAQSCPARVVETEVCNGRDDNCNGMIDEGLSRACENAAYPAGSACRPGTQFCVGGTFGMCVSTTLPATEVCDGVDNDCNGMVDENQGTITCGVGACRRTVNACAMGMRATCAPGAGSPETCNGIDDDCDGMVDEGVTRACMTACGSGVEVCAGGMFGACTARTPSPEVCDGVDNDCDGMTDEDQGSSMCGVGACQRTTPNCVAGRRNACTPGTAQAEVCNGIDDDCDGVTDDGVTRPCTSACGAGTQTCAMGMFGACVTPRSPAPEVCDGLDNDCDGMTDEDLGSSTCGIGMCQRTVPNCVMGMPNPCTPIPGTAETCNGLDDNCNGLVDEGVTRACMSPCGMGTQRCMGGMFGPCMAPSASTEVCNGVDDDCDGMVDEDVPSGPCGRSVGICRPGTFRCVGGRYVCEGETPPRPEECNNLDDDCNGVTDDGNPGGGAMCVPGGVMVDAGAVCAQGTMRCRMGRLVCEGARTGTPEVCNCRDDDCDGQIDNEGATPLCPGGARCVGCRCQTRCATGTEFPCPVGQRCAMGFCEADPSFCGGRYCNEEEQCVNNACVNRCAGVMCPEGQICRMGTCTMNTCASATDCPRGLLCREGRCQRHPCDGVACSPWQFCREGRCVDSCQDAVCDRGQVCRDGRCVTSPCAGMTCPRGQVCRATGANGMCVADPCAGMTCSGGQVCVGGTCQADPCSGIVCQSGEQCTVCDDGVAQCGACNPILAPPRERAVGTGSGGCACSAPGVTPDGRAGLLAAALAALAVASLRRRRRGHRGEALAVAAPVVALAPPPRPAPAARARLAARSTRSLLALLALAAAALAGCRTEPYCFNCTDVARDPDARAPRVDVARIDIPVVPDDAEDADAAVTPDDAEDAAGPTTCDADLQTSVANCGACGRACRPPNAIGVCRMGMCQIERCAPTFYDVDRDPANGCEYECNPSPAGPEVCDGVDNNCNRLIDEDFDLQTDVANCGRCGNACSGNNAVPTCVAGMCQFTCSPGFYDVNRNPMDGCEYGPCFRGDGGGTETCNGLDDDCNGTIDDGWDLQNDPLNCGGCGRACNLPNATSACTMGTCAVARCAPGFADCNRMAVDGCECTCGNLDGTMGPETCDARDNNCNGEVDEGVTEACMTMCGPGMRTCTFGVFGACMARTPSAEVCDGLDNNCNGAIDEGLGDRSCGVGACARTTAACSGGMAQTCTPGTPSPETCNNVDDDCDGMVDEDVTRMCPTTCGEGTQTCAAGAFGPCVGRTPTAETCNNVDDDCNGTVDDGLPQLTCGVGACLRTVSSCRMGAPQTCTPGTPAPEACNGIDDDCNGLADDGAIPGFGTACGMCNRGTTQCVDGRSACVGDVMPSPEICNGVDDDCDGMTDEAPLPGIGPMVTCGSNVGACRFGSVACVAGRPTCQGGVSPGTETCNGIDDDCDGAVDEGVTPPPMMCDRFRPPGAPMPVGVCAGSAPRVACAGSMGFVCTFPGEYRDLRDEARCDGLDNNCDGRTDEGCFVAGPGTDIRIDSDVSANATAPTIHGNGTAVGIAWSQRPLAGGPADIHFANSVDATNFWRTWTVFGRVETNSMAQGNSIEPDLYFQGNNALVAWPDDRSGPSNIYGRRSASAGNTFFRNDENISNQTRAGFNVRVVVWPDNRAMAVWETILLAGADRHVFASTITNFMTEAANWSPAVRVDHAPTGSLGMAVLATDVNVAVGPPGVAYVVWRDNRRNTGDIYFNRTSDGGLTWMMTDTRVNTQPTMVEVPHDAISPSVAAFGNTVYIAWTEVRVPDPMTSVPDRYDIYANTSTNGGMSFGMNSQRIETDPLKHESFGPTAIALSATVGVVVWEDWRSGFPSVRATRTANSGATWLAQDLAAQGGAGGRCCPLVPGRPGASTSRNVVASGAGDTVFIAWEDDRDEPGNVMTRTPSRFNIYANYSLDGGLTYQPADTRLDTAPLGTDQEAPAVFSLNNVGHFTWIDRRNPSPGPIPNHQGDVYYRNLH